MTSNRARQAQATQPPPWWKRPGVRTWTCAPAPGEVQIFHKSLTEYAPTPLIELPQLAAELNVGRVFVKDESCRLGLPAFKALGVFWAVHRLLAERIERTATPVPLKLVTATGGNHGRALARVANRFGVTAHVFLPQGVHPAAEAAIAAEDARITVVDGPYDAAVNAATDAATGPDTVLVQDTAWPGYEQIPAWIVEGYSTLFSEVDAQLAAVGAGSPGLVAVPTGVGSLTQAAVTHYRSRPAGTTTALLAVEPEAAACVMESLTRRQLVALTTGETAMAGLNCGTPSHTAWPYLRDGLDAAVTVGDGDAGAAARDLAALGVPSGPCGASSLAGVRHALNKAHGPERRRGLGLNASSTLVLLSTEGPAANPQFQEQPS